MGRCSLRALPDCDDDLADLCVALHARVCVPGPRARKCAVEYRFAGARGEGAQQVCGEPLTVDERLLRCGRAESIGSRYAIRSFDTPKSLPVMSCSMWARAMGSSPLARLSKL